MRDGRKKKNINFPVIVMTIIAIVGFSLAGIFYKQMQGLKNNPKTAQQEQEAKAAEVKTKVAKLIDLPKDEEPVLMTVNDEAKLKDQPFFKDAKKDDQILIFTESKKAILYRESENKLINVGPIAITSEQKPTIDK